MTFNTNMDEEQPQEMQEPPQEEAEPQISE